MNDPQTLEEAAKIFQLNDPNLSNVSLAQGLARAGLDDITAGFDHREKRYQPCLFYCHGNVVAIRISAEKVAVFPQAPFQVLPALMESFGTKIS